MPYNNGVGSGYKFYGKGNFNCIERQGYPDTLLQQYALTTIHVFN